LRIVAITGGPGSGKSTVAAAFARRGWAVLSADEVAHAVVEPGTACFGRIVSFLGSGVVAPDGRLDRAAVAARVFDPANACLRPNGRVASDYLIELEAIVHPAVRKALARRTKELAGSPGVVWEVPLLFEAGLEGDAESVVAVVVPEEVMLQRLVNKGLTASEAIARIRAQMPIAQKAKLSDYVVAGDLAPEDLDAAVAAIIKGKK